MPPSTGAVSGNKRSPDPADFSREKFFLTITLAKTVLCARLIQKTKNEGCVMKINDPMMLLIKGLIFFIVIFFFSLILAIVYGNGVIYHNFPEIPNMILSFFDHLDGERTYDSIYCNAFVYSFFLLSSVFLLTGFFRKKTFLRGQP